MDDALTENYKKYIERLTVFESFGYDLTQERDAVIEQAQPIKGSILEIGTGKGYFAIALAQQGYRLTSVDVSEEEQRFAKMNIEYLNLQGFVEFQVSDARCLTFPDNSFDMVFSVNVLHHLEQPYEVMDEIIRVLRCGGKIVVSDFSRKGMDLVAKIHRSEGRNHPEGEAVVDHIADYLKKKKFSIQKHRTVFQETVVAHHSDVEKR